MSTHPLLELAVSAAGGLERWQRVREIRATISSGGLAFNGRLRGAKRNLNVSVSPTELRTVFTPYPSRGYRGVFERDEVRIETEERRVVKQLRTPR
jgi:hypothetical protein